MAVTLDSRAGPQHFAASPANATFNNASGTLLVVQVVISDTAGSSGAVTGITYNSVALTKAVTQSWDTNASVAEIWYLANPATGSNPLVVTCSGTASSIHVGAVSFTGADLAAPIRQTAKATGSSNPATVTVPAVASGSIVVDIVGTGSGVTGWGNQLLWVNNFSTTAGGDNTATQYAAVPGGEDAVMRYAITADLNGIVAVEVRAALDALTESASSDVALDVYGPFRPTATAFQPSAFQSSAFQIYGGGASGPSTFNESVSESALAQDNLATVEVMPVSLSEQALAQDSVAAKQVIPESETGSALARDAVDAKIVALATLSESATATDVAIGLLQMPVGFQESAVADVLFDATLLSPGGGSVINESLSEGASAQDSLATALVMGAGIEAKIGTAARASTIFVFDD